MNCEKKLKKIESESALSMRILECGNCIEIGKRPNKNWHYYKVYDVSVNSIFYYMYILTKNSHITTTCTDNEFPLYFIKTKELRRKKLERLKALSN